MQVRVPDGIAYRKFDGWPIAIVIVDQHVGWLYDARFGEGAVKERGCHQSRRTRRIHHRISGSNGSSGAGHCGHERNAT